ncbi:hypothetical protein CAEBREN_14425 [Caenorhabditis brenneri]|uniref:G-protein coupled receptors family 1 profile domain-containing protein n=1 Tax=Caenorhabditis brenneri TaxID=135651 RepID=G0MU93_CAEBE|nr:hypothetical protein CAEBREN_14425 [Caenorhabditis brenneri]
MKTTTEYFPFFNEEDNEIYDSHPDYSDDYVFGNRDSQFAQWMVILRLIFSQIYDIAVFVSFFVNLPHLFILVQKELRTNLVYIIMMGICLSDLMHSLSKIFALSMMWDIFYVREECIEGDPYFHIVTNILAMTVQIITRRCSSLLALFIAAFRAFSVIFPMSNAVNFMMKAKSGYLIVLLVASICIGWGAYFFKQTHIEFVRKCQSAPRPSYQMYHFTREEKWETRYRMIDGSISVVISLTYLFVVFALVIALAAAQKRRKGLKSDKPNNTTFLILMMAFSLFLSEITYAALFYLNFLVFYDTFEQRYFDDMDMVAIVLVIINSCNHCIICFFMSSQYRDVVKRLVCCCKKEENVENVAVVESSAHPTTKTYKVSNDSKKTY